MHMKGSFFDSLKTMGEDVTLHRYQGFTSAGGHERHIFAAAETISVLVRPWESDMRQQVDEGDAGQTVGMKLYAEQSLNLKRGDRIEYRNGEFRIMNPQYDQLNDLERWDIKEDDRTLVLESSLATGTEVQPPQSDFGDY